MSDNTANTTAPAAEDEQGGYIRTTLELPAAEAARIKEYARDKGVTAKFVMQRALTLYFEKVNEKEDGKYKIQPIDNRDIL